MLFYLISSLWVRIAGVAILSLALSLWGGKIGIRKFKEAGWVDRGRRFAPPTHHGKKGIPVGGGIFIMGALLLSLLIFGNFTDKMILLTLLVSLFLGLIGFWDDEIKILKKSSRGLRIRTKLVIQLVPALAVALFLYYQPFFDTRLRIPFTGISLAIGWGYIPLMVLVLMCVPISVNITDGLDGLVAGCMLFAGMAYGVLAYVAGSTYFHTNLNAHYVPGAEEMVVFWAALLGATLGFLWYNRYPAKVFMGETGAQLLGGALAMTAILIKREILLLVIGGVFVLEALSVILQVISFRLAGRRILRMSPIHHHYELKGVEESKIVVHFWILALLLALAGLSSLKW
jgi:phospho-N-acetylmuramoyl-pentapeptide-transferase